MVINNINKIKKTVYRNNKPAIVAARIANFILNALFSAITTVNNNKDFTHLSLCNLFMRLHFPLPNNVEIISSGCHFHLIINGAGTDFLPK